MTAPKPNTTPQQAWAPAGGATGALAPPPPKLHQPCTPYPLTLSFPQLHSCLFIFRPQDIRNFPESSFQPYRQKKSGRRGESAGVFPAGTHVDTTNKDLKQPPLDAFALQILSVPFSLKNRSSYFERSSHFAPLQGRVKCCSLLQYILVGRCCFESELT